MELTKIKKIKSFIPTHLYDISKDGSMEFKEINPSERNWIKDNNWSSHVLHIKRLSKYLIIVIFKDVHQETDMPYPIHDNAIYKGKLLY